MGMLQFCAWHAQSSQGSHFNEDYKKKKKKILSIHLESSSTKSHISEDMLLIAV